MTMAERESWYAFWGKTDRRSKADLPPHHLLPYHNLDVAAASEVLLQRDGIVRKRLAEGLRLSENKLVPFFCALMALHDVGKFAEGFQHLCKPLADHLSGQKSEKKHDYLIRHDTLGYLIWRDVLHPIAIEENWFGTRDVADDMTVEDWRDYFDPIMQAVTGHHGAPPQAGSYAARQLFSSRSQKDATIYAREVVNLFGPLRPFESFDYDEHLAYARRSTWRLAGLAILADWIGSDATHFRFVQHPLPLRKYWDEVALPRAEEAVTQAGVIAPAIAPSDSQEPLHSLFPGLSVHRPTPLQRYVSHTEACPLADGPQLFILEDATGAGKTEAALILAHRLMQHGEATGLYFGLPTMTTADRIYDRLIKPYRCLYEGGAQASLILAHSGRELHKAFRNTLRIGDPSVEAGEQYTSPPQGKRKKQDGNQPHPEDGTGQAECAAWLADKRKAALLACVGAGTIDQALLGVLPSKHQALRLLGLGQHVLIVDEVHAYDEYVSRLLRELLAFQAAQGGSAILLSATLTGEQRQKVCDAFRDGLKLERLPLHAHADFPLVTHVSKEETIREQSVGQAPGTARTVSVRLVNEVQDAQKELLEAAQAGRCACWIRNTVDDAVRAWRALREQHEHPERVLLFHARMAQIDRAAIAGEVEKRFGKRSRAVDRTSYILIATQVVEQSLDLDFDVMVSDLAPIDLLIQRAGRLHRHARTAASDPDPTGDDKRGEPTLLVLSPPLNADPPKDWYAKLFPKGQYVYPHIGLLWRTARALQEYGKISTPDLARTLLQKAYGDDAKAVPENLEKASNDAVNEMKLARAQAGHNALHLDGGYGSLKAGGQRWFSPERTPTRLGEPTTTVRLARWEDSVLIPWAAEDADAFHALQQAFENAKQRAEEVGWTEATRESIRQARAALMAVWQMSEVSVRKRLLAEGPKLKKNEQEALDEVLAAMPDDGKWSVLVTLQEQDETWTGEARNGDGKTVRITYSSEAGLDVEQK